MHVVIASDYGNVNGGAAKVAILSARLLAERGHRVSFVCAVEPIDSALNDPRISIHNLGLRDVWQERNPVRAAARGIWNRSSADRIRRLLTGFDRDQTIVHVHQWTRAFSPSILRAVADSRLAHVVTLHDYFLFCPNGLYFDHARRTPCWRRPLGASCLAAACDTHSRAHKAVRLVRQVASNVARRGLGPPLNLIHVSRPARDIAEPHFPSDTRHFVVHNPVGMPKLAPVEVARNDSFVYLGRFTPEKGPTVFARAAAEAGVRAVFLGSGPEESRIRAANPQAEVLNWGDERAVEALFERARALVFPSLWHETSGLAVLEALSRGVPVICSRGTGAADWIEDGVNGCLVPPGDPPALADGLVRLADDLVTRLGRAAYRQYWHDSPTADAHARHLEVCYEIILSREPSARCRGERPGTDPARSAA